MSEDTPNNRTVLEVLYKIRDRLDAVEIEQDFGGDFTAYKMLIDGMFDEYALPCAFCGEKNGVSLTGRMKKILSETKQFGAPFICKKCGETTVVAYNFHDEHPDVIRTRKHHRLDSHIKRLLRIDTDSEGKS